jgi:DNA mismatch endonuclease (patch repair protein)
MPPFACGRTPQRDTAPELALRRAVHALGLRYRVDVAPAHSMPRRRVDLVFSSARVAVFLDGCFWHGCPIHGETPRANREWWRRKIDRNRERDIETSRILKREGWEVIRVWEHEDPREAALRVAEAVRPRRMST